MKKYEFTPDYQNIVMAARNQAAPRLPLYEHIVCGEIMEQITGVNPCSMMSSSDPVEMEEGYVRFWDFWKQMGYDIISFECSTCGILPGGGALGAHKKGVIQSRADFENYPWDTLCDAYFERYAPIFRILEKTRPEGMKAVGGVGNGIFECVQDLVGYIDLCFMREDDPELYADLFRRMGQLHVQIWKRFLAEYADAFCVMRFGDDLGFNTMTLLSEADIKTHILPWYRQITDLVHEAGYPFLLHSCGNLLKVFDDIISLANIDAKHSNEDSIAHFSVWAERFGDRIGNFGGIDTDVLCRQTPEEIRAYVFDCLEKVKNCGGIAFSSGNSIPNYVPLTGYLAMIEAVRDWRGDKEIKA